jgi:phytol kinase
MDFIAHKGLITSRISRKVIHIGTGPIFVMCWLLFPDVWYARYLAALVPGLITVQFALTGMGVIMDEASVKAMSRSGDPKEILRGPLYYGIMFVLLTILFWKDHPAGVVALMMLCGGDGIADLVGRGIPSPKLPWSQKKSVAGTISVFLGGLAFSLAVLWAFNLFGIFPLAYTKVGTLALIALLATVVESFPMADVDNLTISVMSALLGWLWL